MTIDVTRLMSLYRWGNTEGLHRLLNPIWALQTHGLPNNVPADQNNFFSFQIGADPAYPQYMHIDRSKAPQLLKVVEELEKVYSKSEYSNVRRSEAVAKAIFDRKDSLKKGSLEAMAVQVVKMKRPDNFIEGMRVGLRIAGVVREVPLTVAVANQTYVFEGEEGDLVQKILDLPSKKSAPTPKKVLVKMAALRFYKLRKHVDQTKERIKNNTYYGNHALVKWNMPELTSLDVAKSLVSPQTRSILSGMQHAYVLDDLQEFLSRPELDDEVVVDAWNRVLVGDVMEA